MEKEIIQEEIKRRKELKKKEEEKYDHENPYNNYCIGDIVDVSFLAKPDYNKNTETWVTTRTWQKNNKNKPNSIAYYVGYMYGQNGYLIKDKNNAFVQKKTILLARIRFHPRGKEHYAFFEDIRMNPMYAMLKRWEEELHEKEKNRRTLKQFPTYTETKTGTEHTGEEISDSMD